MALAKYQIKIVGVMVKACIAVLSTEIAPAKYQIKIVMS